MTETPKVQRLQSPAIEPQAPAPLYFAVSPTKLLIMATCTFSIYEFYWFYKNWQLIKQRDNSAISPFWRAFFTYFFCYSLFSHIRSTASKNNVDVTLPAGPLAAGWIVLTLLLELPDAYGLLGFLATVLLVPVQVAANAINAKLVPGHDRNERFTAGNIAAAIIGGLLLVALIYGTYFLPG